MLCTSMTLRLSRGVGKRRAVAGTRQRTAENGRFDEADTISALRAVGVEPGANICHRGSALTKLQVSAVAWVDNKLSPKLSTRVLFLFPYVCLSVAMLALRKFGPMPRWSSVAFPAFACFERASLCSATACVLPVPVPRHRPLQVPLDWAVELGSHASWSPA